MKRIIVATIYASWLLAIEVLFYAFEGRSEAILEAAVILGAIPTAVQIGILGFNPYGLVGPVRAALAFVLIVLLSYLANADWNSLVYLVELLFIFSVAIVVAGSPDPRLMRNIGALYSAATAVFLFYVVVTGKHDLLGRLTAGTIQPNWWGLMGVCLVVTAFAHRSRLLAAFCIGVGCYVIYDASSRNSMVAIAVAAVAICLAGVPRLRGSRLVATAVAAIGVLVALMFFLPSIHEVALPTFDSLLKLDDPYRGVGTGFTGRSDLWAAALEAWLKSPLFGVGFHQHQGLTPGYLGAHQAYLGMLADTGVLGLLWYVGFIVSSLYAALGIRDAQSRNVVVAVIAAYAAVGMFEARGINGGNPFSIYFQMCCFFALTQASLRRAVAGRPIGASSAAPAL